MKLIQNKFSFIQFLFILLINFFLTIQNEIQFQFQTNLLASDGNEYDLFGYSVSISNDGNIALIGAYGATVGNNTKQGKAYIFQKNGIFWNQTQILIANDGEAYDEFGNSLSISNDGNIALIGAPWTTVGNNTWQGKAYIFQKNETFWNQTQILIASDGGEGDWFGTSVSISNDGSAAFIGALGATVGNNISQGKAYIFQKNETFWNQTQILNASDGEANDMFGYNIFLSGNYEIISAPGHDSDKGEVYLFFYPIIPYSPSSSNSKTTIIVISIVIPIIVILLIILTIFFIRKKKKRKQQQNQ